MRDTLLKMRHEHEVPALAPPVVKSVVVDVTQHGSSSDPVGRVVSVDVFAECVHLGSTRLWAVVFSGFVVHLCRKDVQLKRGNRD